MPTVPRIDIPSGAGIGGPSGVFSNADRAATPDAFGASVGQAEQRFGGAIEHASDVMEKQANYLQDRANQAAATDMFVGGVQSASEVVNWHRNQMGKNAADTLPEFMRKIEDVRQKYVDQAPNFEVRRMFDQDFKRRMGFMISDAATYAANQNKQYNIAQAKARQDISIQAAGNAKDDAEFNNSLVDAKIGAANEAEELGLPPDQKKLHLDNAVSTAWQTRLATIAMTDPFRAKELYDKNKETITNPAARLTIEHNLQNQYNSVGTRVVSHAIENGTPIPNLPAGLGGTTYREAISTNETGHIKGDEARYNAEGPIITNTKSAYYGDRAYGIYQVMGKNIGPWTKEVLGKEMTPNEFKKDHAAQDAVFDAKFGQLLDKYGNPQDAASAWHSGRPLAEATAAGATDGGMRTADYVSKFNRTLGATPVEPLTTSSGPEWLANATDRAKVAAQKIAPDNPNFEDLLVHRVQAAYNNVQTVKNRVNRENYNDVKGALLETDQKSGLPTITSMDQILDNPALNQRYQALDKGSQNAVQAQITRNSKVDVPMDDARLKRYNNLKGQAVLDPAKFRDVDIMVEDIPRSSKKELLNLQIAAEKRSQDTTGMTRALSTVTPMLNDAGIRRSATDANVSGRYNQFVGAFQTERDQWIKDNGGKVPADKDNQRIAAQVLRVVQESTFRFGFGQDERRQFEVPTNQVDTLKKDLRESLGREPTPSDIYRLFQIRNKNAVK